jgi:hypothetical protein
MTGTLSLEAGPLPTLLFAVTVKRYAVPLLRPVTVQVAVEGVAVQVLAPGKDMTVNPVIAAPPVLVGAVHRIEASALPPVAATSVGAPGTVVGVTEGLAAEGRLQPSLLLAVTVKV